MGFPLDYWETDYIQDAVCSFGRVDNWINNRRRLTRLIVRVRVADLQSIPQWIVYSDGIGNDLDSWTIQCEIVSHDFVGGGPPPEDPAPQHLDHLAPFDFFGLGQAGAGPMNPGPNQQFQGGHGNLGVLQGQGNNQGQADQLGEENQDEEEINPNAQWDFLAAQNGGAGNMTFAQGQGIIQGKAVQPEEENHDVEDINPNTQWDLLASQNAQNVAWDQWPDEQMQQPPNGQNIGNMEIDLNGAPNPDMQEVIINLAVADLNGDFLELNNFIQDADEEVIHLIEQNPGFGPNNPLDNQE